MIHLPRNRHYVQEPAVSGSGERNVLRDQRTRLHSSDEGVARDAARCLSHDPSPETIAALVWAIGRPGIVADAATEALIAIGPAAAGALIGAMHASNVTRRWHGAKAFTEVQSPMRTPAFIAALRDDNAAVRWQAVAGLTAVGPAALAPLLRALYSEGLSAWLAVGARRVLRRLEPYFPDLRLEVLIGMLGDRQAHVGVPPEAFRLWSQLVCGGPPGQSRP